MEQETTSLNKLNKMDMSLSEIFDWADKNVIHARWIFGDAKHNLCCALGAVNFVLSDGRTTVGGRLKRLDRISYERAKFLKREFIKRDKYHLSLAMYNDFLFYSFKHLAQKCRSLGL